MVFFICFKLYFSPEDDLEIKLKSLSLLICFIAFCFASILSFLIDRSLSAFNFAIYAALLSNLYYYSSCYNSKKTKSFTFNYKIAGWLSLPILILSIYIVTLQKLRSESDLNFKIALIQYSQQKYKESIESCKKSLAANKYKYKAYLIAANASFVLGDYEEAEKNIEKGIEYYPNDLRALVQAGIFFNAHFVALQKTENPDEKELIRLSETSKKYFDRVLKIRPDATEIIKRQNNL